MDDIVAASSASKGSLYFHFPNKEEIFFGLIETFIGLLESRLKETLSSEQRGMEQLDLALQESLRLFEQYRALAKIVLVQAIGLGAAFEQRRRAINDRFVALIRERIEKGIRDGSLPPQDAELTARAWVGALNEILVHWIYTGTPNLQTALPEIKALLARSVGAKQSSQ